MTLQVSVIPLEPPHLCPLEQQLPTDIIHLTKMTKVETGFPDAAMHC